MLCCCRVCEQPASMEPHEWPDDITKWPVSMARGTVCHGQLPCGICIPLCRASAGLLGGLGLWCSSCCLSQTPAQGSRAVPSQGSKPSNNRNCPVPAKALDPVRVTERWKPAQPRAGEEVSTDAQADGVSAPSCCQRELCLGSGFFPRGWFDFTQPASKAVAV